VLRRLRPAARIRAPASNRPSHPTTIRQENAIDQAKFILERIDKGKRHLICAATHSPNAAPVGEGVPSSNRCIPNPRIGKFRLLGSATYSGAGGEVFRTYRDQTHFISGSCRTERGVIFRACNFLYCGPTSPTEKFRRPDGKVYDARNVHLLTRDRRFGRLQYKRTRAEQKQLLTEQGCEFFKDNGCKHRFVGIFGDRRIKRILRAALRWAVLAYPKREPSPEDRVQVVDLNSVPKNFSIAPAL
jgi:hypothetical protein